jgi:inosose dehydratase
MGMETRRDVLKALGLIAGAGAVAKMTPMARAEGRLPEGIHLGTQLNAYPMNGKDFNTVLAAIDNAKSIGFRGFETGFGNLMPQFDAPEHARAAIAATGMTFFGIHIFLQHKMYDTTTLIAPRPLYEKVAKGGKALGAHNVILSGAAAADVGQLKTKVEGLNAAGEYCRSLGMGVAYHNEEPESGSKIGELDYLYSNAGPDVHFLLDVGHLFNVGGDVVAFIRKHHARIIGFHLRDYKDHKQVVLGQGDLPLKEIAETLERAHWHGWAECEEERLDGVKHGAEYLRPAFGALKAAFTT